MTAGSTVEVVVGRIGRPHGVAGAVFVDVRTDEPERRFAAGTVFETVRGRLELESTRWHGRRLVARFVGVADRNQAAALSGVELTLEVPADERPDDEEEFYDHQLLGLDVALQSGERIGTVVEVLHLPSQDLLVVADSTSGTTERLVPFVRELVPTVDLAARRLVVVDQSSEG